MIEKLRKWLLLMMVPFFFGAFTHFIVPTGFALSAYPRVEHAYNNYKIEVEQNLVRALTILNSNIVESRVQTIQDVRRIFRRIYRFETNYMKIDLSQMSLNSAYQLANQNTSEQIDLKKSMWLCPGVSRVEDMSPVQKSRYIRFQLLEPYLRSNLQKQIKKQGPILYIKWSVTVEGEEIAFRYPSSVEHQYRNLNAPIIDHQMNQTILNYKQHGFSQSTFLHDNVIVLNCISLLEGEVVGVVSLGLNTKMVVDELVSSLKTPNFEFSVNHYYILRPLYSQEERKQPQIIANFSNNNLSLINIPTQPTFFSFEEHSLRPELFFPGKNQSFHIERLGVNKIYYTIPMRTFDGSQRDITLYLVIVNHYKPVQIVREDRFRGLIVALVIPTVTLFIGSVVIAYLVLRLNLRQLEESMNDLNHYSHHMLQDDLDLEIQVPNRKQTEDIKQLYEVFQTLNLLNKFSTPAYFDVLKPQRLIKYLSCCQIFQKQGYNKTNLLQNIADCYVAMGDPTKAISTMEQSISLMQRVFSQQFGSINQNFAKKQKKAFNNDHKYRKYQKHLIRKIYKLSQFLYFTFQPGDHARKEKIKFNLDKLMKLTYPRILNIEYIGALIINIRTKFKDGDVEDMDTDLELLDHLITGYEEKHADGARSGYQLTPNMMRGVQKFIRATWDMQNKRYLQAYHNYVAALRSNYYHPSMYPNVVIDLKKLLEINGVSPECLNSFKYLDQYKPRTEREYIFVVDISNSTKQIEHQAIWRSKSQIMAEFIFDNFIKADDRLCIYDFCQDLVSRIHLINKNSQENVIRKQLMNAFKSESVQPCVDVGKILNEAVHRIQHLEKEKILLLFVKNGKWINQKQIYQAIRPIEKSCKVLIFMENRKFVSGFNEAFYVVNLDWLQDCRRILQEKKHVQKDKRAYVFL